MLTSSLPEIVQVPAEVVVQANQSSRAFPVTTSVVASDTVVTVTATARCCGATGTRSGPLTVTSAAPAPTDTVTIQRAEWRPGGRGGTIRVEARIANPNAILSVYHTASGAFFFTLTNLGNGRYEGSWSKSGSNPRNITVKSNLGGSASANLRVR
jgi:hypothetical protein